MSRRVTGLLGLAATLLFAAALVFFAAAHPGYEHGTKAVSELGATGAPNALAWNLIGFLLPGVLLALFGLGLGATVQDRRTGLYLTLSGIAFAATAVPADMESLQSPLSLAHIVASLMVFLFWLPASLRLLKQPAPELRRITIFFLLFAVAAAAIRFTPLLLPGWGQRLSFLAYFGWIGTVSLLLVVSKTTLLETRDVR
jgi:hypothetical membrane protein